MLIHKEALIKCSESEARNVFTSMCTLIEKGADWVVDRDWMAETSLQDYDFRDGLFVICTKVLNDIHHYGVIIQYSSTKRGIFIPNIIPIIKRELSVLEYNICFDQFWEAIGRYITKGYKCILGGGEVTIEELLTPSLLRLFKEFDLLANRKSLHPLDEQRWRNFVIKMASSRRRLDKRQIHLLFLAFGWNKDKALEMSSRYVNELSIIRQYRHNRS